MESKGGGRRPLSAADRPPQPGDVVRLATGMHIHYTGQDAAYRYGYATLAGRLAVSLYIEGKADEPKPTDLYVSRADGGPLVAEAGPVGSVTNGQAGAIKQA